MKILILGAGKMGTFLTDALCLHHQVALYDPDATRLRFIFNTQRITQLQDIKPFKPQLLINAATIKYTIPAFEAALPYIPNNCIISDIASVKAGLPEFYQTTGRPFVSTHPMFGPTFARLDNLSNENAIIIKESCEKGKKFFRQFYQSLQLNIFEYTFQQHDQTTAYSLSLPFVSTLIFAGNMKHQEAPGTTFKKCMNVAQGLLSEDDYLLTEILFNPHTPQQMEKIQKELQQLQTIIQHKDTDNMKKYLSKIRKNLQ